MLLATLALSLLNVVGCSSNAGCPELCAKEAECNNGFGTQTIDVKACTDECEALTEDDAAYADAVAERAACLDGIDCNDYFTCQASGE